MRRKLLRSWRTGSTRVRSISSWRLEVWSEMLAGRSAQRAAWGSECEKELRERQPRQSPPPEGSVAQNRRSKAVCNRCGRQHKQRKPHLPASQSPFWPYKVKGVAYFNMGAEYEHLKKHSEALWHYQRVWVPKLLYG